MNWSLTPQCDIRRYIDVGFGDEGYLRALEPMCVKINTSGDDGNATFKLPRNNNDEARRLLKTAEERMGV